MSRARGLALITTSLTAVCLFRGTNGASAASFGRCVKLVVKETGKYGSSGCQEGRVAHGNYEWYPAFGAEKIKKTGFELKVSESPTVYEGSEAVEAFSCSSEGKGSGEFTSSTQVGNVELILKSCKDSPTSKCSNTGTEGEVKTEKLSGEIGVWKAEGEERHNKVGLELHAATGEEGTVIKTMTCTDSFTRKLTGSIIAMVPPDGPNKMGTTWSLKYMHRGVEQMPEKFEGLPKPTAFEETLNEAFSRPAAMEATIEQENEETMELNTTCTC